MVQSLEEAVSSPLKGFKLTPEHEVASGEDQACSTKHYIFDTFLPEVTLSRWKHLRQICLHISMGWVILPVSTGQRQKSCYRRNLQKLFTEVLWLFVELLLFIDVVRSSNNTTCTTQNLIQMSGPIEGRCLIHNRNLFLAPA